MWWVRVAIVLALVVAGALMTKGALMDGERGLKTLPWLVAGTLGLIYLAWPRRSS